MVTWKREPLEETPLDPGTTLAGLVVRGQDLRLTSAEVATATTLTADHYLVLVKNGAKITVPKAILHKNRAYTIKNMSKSVIELVVVEGGTIDGAKTLKLNLQYSFVTFTSDASEWLIIGGVNVKLDEILDAKLSELIELQEKTLTAVRVTNRHEEEANVKQFNEKDIQLEASEGVSKRYL